MSFAVDFQDMILLPLKAELYKVHQLRNQQPRQHPKPFGLILHGIHYPMNSTFDLYLEPQDQRRWELLYMEYKVVHFKPHYQSHNVLGN